MTVLSDRQMLRDHATGRLVIEPFDRRNINTSSYDVCLGRHYWKEQRPALGGKRLFNIYSSKEVLRVWGEHWLAAVSAREAYTSAGFDWDRIPVDEKDGISEDDDVILIGPGETMLCHTEEFIGGRHNRTTMMKARSSFGRDHIEVCKCAGWGDVGYTNRWTMEVTNNSQWYYIPLVCGRRIAQIAFFKTGRTLGNEYHVTGNYQDTDDIEKLKQEWSPMLMLPRLDRDRDIRPVLQTEGVEKHSQVESSLTTDESLRRVPRWDIIEAGP